MSEMIQPVATPAARTLAQNVQARLNQRKKPAVSETRELTTTVLSLCTQLEEARQTVSDSQTQLEQLKRLIVSWNELFEALRRVELSIWEELKGGVCYQWQGGPVVSGFTSWTAAVEAALLSRLD